MQSLWVKICGITNPDQGRAIAQLGATAVGFICVQQSPRYVTPEQIRQIVAALPENQSTKCVGVFVNADLETLQTVTSVAHLQVLQLHGNESPEFCQYVRAALPQVELIKAVRVRQPADLAIAESYTRVVDALLLDAYHPTQFGGTGKTLDWQMLRQFRPSCPWFLAGGLTPNNICEALSLVRPDGIDLSSGVERSPGDKDLDKVAHLFRELQPWLKPTPFVASTFLEQQSN